MISPIYVRFLSYPCIDEGAAAGVSGDAFQSLTTLDPGPLSPPVALDADDAPPRPIRICNPEGSRRSTVRSSIATTTRRPIVSPTVTIRPSSPIVASRRLAARRIAVTLGSGSLSGSRPGPPARAAGAAAPGTTAAAGCVLTGAADLAGAGAVTAGGGLVELSPQTWETRLPWTAAGSSMASRTTASAHSSAAPRASSRSNPPAASASS